jgi:hypothetical protein
MSRAIEYPPIENLDLEEMWDGLDFPPLSFPLSRDAVVASASAGAGMLLGSWGIPKLSFLSTPLMRSLASIAGGLVGGYLLYDINRPAAAGLSAGMIGQGLATIVGGFINQKVSLEEGDITEADLLGLGDAVVDEETLLTGLGAGNGTDEDLFGFGDAEVKSIPPYELTGMVF